MITSKKWSKVIDNLLIYKKSIISKIKEITLNIINIIKERLKNIQLYFVNNFFNDYHNWLLWIPVIFSCGILVRFNVNYSISLLYLILFIILSFLLKKYQLITLIFIILNTFLIGYIRTNFYIKNKNKYVLINKLNNVKIIGKIDNIYYSSKNIKKNFQYKTNLIIKVEKILDEKNNIVLKQLNKIKINFNEEYNNLKFGEYIKIQTNLIPTKDKKSHFQNINALSNNGIILEDDFIKEKNKNIKISFINKMYNFRKYINQKYINSIGFRNGSLIASFITGDRERIFEEDYDSLTIAGLVHLIAISGMNMTIIMGIIFTLIRYFLAHFESITLKYNIKKISSIFAIIIGFLYLCITDFPASANRAYIMSFLYFVGILIDKEIDVRRFICFSALLLSFINPYIIFDIGFLLSFFAVLGLVTGFNILKEYNIKTSTQSKILKPFFYIYINFLSSLFAELSILPITIYFFNSFSLYSIFTNIIAIPLTSIITLPLSIFSIFLFAFHLEKLLLIPCSWSIDILLNISNYMNKFNNSTIIFSSPTIFILLLSIFSFLWFCLWEEKWKFLGLLFFFISFLLFIFQPKIDILIDKNNKIIILNENKNVFVSKNINNFQEQTIKKYFGTNKYFTNLEKYCLYNKKTKSSYENCINFVKDLNKIFKNNDIENNFKELNNKYFILEKKYKIIII